MTTIQAQACCVQEHDGGAVAIAKLNKRGVLTQGQHILMAMLHNRQRDRPPPAEALAFAWFQMQ